MKKNKFLLSVLVALTAFTAFSQEKRSGGDEQYISVGGDVVATNILTAHQMQEQYSGLKAGDTLNVTFKADVASVCKKKGCWMNVALEDGREVMVKFRDYAFFVPKDIEDREVIVDGKAYVTEMSVEDRKHYAKDAGKSTAEVDAINTPQITLSFLANGVKIKNN